MERVSDPTFNTIVDEALRESLSLQMAQLRVLQAYALVNTKKAATLPSLGASVSTTLQDELKGVESQKDAYAASLNASYEVDLFGKKEDALDAATASFQASFEALHISGISLVAELGNAWYTLGYKTQSLSLLEQQREVAEKILHVAKLKHANGKKPYHRCFITRTIHRFTGCTKNCPRRRYRSTKKSHQPSNGSISAQ